MTHLSGDEVLYKIFTEGGDMHSTTAVGMWNMTYPEDKVEYDYFEYCRNNVGLFVDKDGNLLENKLEQSNLDKLLAEGKIKTATREHAEEIVTKGNKFEKFRKNAKSVNSLLQKTCSCVILLLY